MSGKKPHLSLILNHIVSFMIIKAIESYSSSSSEYHTLAIYIWNLILRNYCNILIYLSKFLCFRSIGIKIIRLFENQEESLFLKNLSLKLSKKELKTTKKQNKSTKQLSSPNKKSNIPRIIIQLFILILSVDFEKLDDPKQRIEIINTIAKILKKTKTTDVPIYSLWLNDNGNSWDSGSGV